MIPAYVEYASFASFSTRCEIDQGDNGEANRHYQVLFLHYLVAAFGDGVRVVVSPDIGG